MNVLSDVQSTFMFSNIEKKPLILVEAFQLVLISLYGLAYIRVVH